MALATDDKFTMEHLTRWCESTLHDDEMYQVWRSIVQYIERHGLTTDDELDWPRIRRYAAGDYSY